MRRQKVCACEQMQRISSADDRRIRIVCRRRVISGDARDLDFLFLDAEKQCPDTIDVVRG